MGDGKFTSVLGEDKMLGPEIEIGLILLRCGAGALNSYPVTGCPERGKFRFENVLPGVKRPGEVLGSFIDKVEIMSGPFIEIVFALVE